MRARLKMSRMRDDNAAMNSRQLLPLCILLIASLAATKPASHTIRDISGWKVHVDARLLADENKPLGDHAMHMLADRLDLIVWMVPADKVKRLQQVPIYLDLNNGKLDRAQYHPGADWLTENGYNPEMAKAVHIPDAAKFVSPVFEYEQPMAVLHEFSHAYHDQVLGFDDPRIIKAWKQFVDSGKYKSVLHINGRQREHYALTNEKEFFAEMTETYFGMNDFYPFNSAELQRDEPGIYKLLQEIWGPLPDQAARRKS